MTGRVVAESSQLFSRRPLITAYAKRLLRVFAAQFLGKLMLHESLLKGGLMNELPMIETSYSGERITSEKKRRSLPGVTRNSKGFLRMLKFKAVENKGFRTDHKTVIRAEETKAVHRLSADTEKDDNRKHKITFGGSTAPKPLYWRYARQKGKAIRSTM